MSHENLKFNLNIRKNRELRKNEDWLWQPILATEYMGTFFMVYISINKVENVTVINDRGKKQTITSVNCKFRIQNFRGSIKMGFPKGAQPNVIEEIDRNCKLQENCFCKNKGYHYTIELPIKPFESRDILDSEPTLTFPNGFFGGKTIFETEPIYQDIDKSIFDPENPNDSKFIHPLYMFREGDNIQHIYYKKNEVPILEKTPENECEKLVIKDELIGGPYDCNILKETHFDKNTIDIQVSTVKKVNCKGPHGIGTNGSPTCDAKRTEVFG